MPDFLLEMEWHVCVDGYRVGPAQGPADSEILIAKSERYRFYKPFHRHENLYLTFAWLQTRDELLNFANQFGEPDGKTIKDSLRTASNFRELLDVRRTSNKKIYTAFRRQTAFEMVQAENKPSGKQLDISRMIEENVSLGVGTVDLAPDPINGIRLDIKPFSLKHGLWVQLARKLSRKLLIQRCRYCGARFEVGPGAKKRSDATFCCAEHSVRFHSFNRSKAGQLEYG
jgi:hypothetical protein